MWEIYAYQNADSLLGVLNAGAAIHASGDYAAVLAAVAWFGFVAAMIAYVFAPHKLQGWQWLATVLLVFGVLVVPKVTVGVVDKTGGSPVKVVDNVPLGAALLISVTSTIGHTLTTLFETVFQTIPGIGALPSELTYQQHGLLFGHRLIRETGAVVFQDPGYRADLINFLHNCTSYDLIDGTLQASTFSMSDNVWPLIGSPNPARFTTVTAPAGTVDIDTCPNAYQSLNTRLPAQLQRIQGRLAFQLNPTLPAPVAAAVISAQVQQAYIKNGIADASATAADLIRQNAMLNAIADTSAVVGQKVNDPAAMVLAVGRAQAVAQQNATWLNDGKVAEQSLPVLRNVIEAVSYAMFPLFVLLLLLTSGRETVQAVKGYATILIWIQLWPPLFAVLNYMASVYAAFDLAAAADLGTGAKALALQTSSVIYSRTISGEAIVGYLSITVPFIAWAALKRMENFGTVLAGGLSGLQATLSGATSAAAVGNAAMGNVTMDQMQLAPVRTSAFMRSWQNDLSGNTFTGSVLSGRTAVNMLRNQGFASRTVSVQVSEDHVQDASRQVAAARSDAVAANSERSAVLAEAFTKGMSKLRATRNSSGETSSSFEQLGDTLTKIDQISKSVAENHNLTQAQVVRLGLGAAGNIGYGGKFGTAKGGVSANAGLEKAYMSGLSASEQRAMASLTSDQIAAFKQFGDRVSRDRNYANLISQDSREAQEFSSRLTSTVAFAERAEAALSERTAFAERISSAFRSGEAISLDVAQDPYNMEMALRYAEQYGGNSESARAMMDAELARRSLGPNRAFSDGTALPSTFGGVTDIYRASATATASSRDIASQHQANDSEVRLYRTEMPHAKPDPIRSSLRTDIHVEGERIRTGAQADRDAFEKKSEIVETPDGTLASKRSLLKNAGKQVLKDGEVTMGNAVDTVKDLLRK